MRPLLSALLFSSLLVASPHGDPSPSNGPPNSVPLLSAEDLTELLCPNAHKASAPPASMPDSANQGSREAAERLAEEMERFVGCHVFSFLNDPDAYSKLPADANGCGPEKHGPLHFGEKARAAFENYFGIEPCHGDILSQTTGTLRDAWWNRGDLPGYFGALEPLLDERAAKFPKIAKALRDKIRDFEAQARKVSPPANDSGPPANLPTMAQPLACFEKRFAGNALAFYALFQGKHRVSPDAWEASWAKVSQACAKAKAKDACLLKQLGYPLPERSAELYAKHQVAVLGYEDAGDLEFFDGVMRKYPALYDAKQGKHAIRALLAPDGVDVQTNEWDGQMLAIRFWGESHLRHRSAEAAAARQKHELSEEAHAAVEADIASLRHDRPWIFVHESSHSVDTRFLQTENPSALGQEWNAIGWRKTAQGWRHKDQPFSCQGIAFPQNAPTAGAHDSAADAVARKYGFVTYYATTNPAEDFAETGALFFTDPARLKKIAPRKQTFFEKLFAAPVK